MIDKRAVLEALRSRVAEQLRTLTASQHAAQSGAVHEETRQEHPKDTRAIEAQYLARGLAARVETLRDALSALGALRVVDYAEDDPIGVGALVTVADDDGREADYFLVPAAGGEVVTVAGRTVQALTPVSPLGRALADKCAGDEVEVDLPGGRRTLAITGVR